MWLWLDASTGKVEMEICFSSAPRCIMLNVSIKSLIFFERGLNLPEKQDVYFWQLKSKRKFLGRQGHKSLCVNGEFQLCLVNFSLWLMWQLSKWWFINLLASFLLVDSWFLRFDQLHKLLFCWNSSKRARGVNWKGTVSVSISRKTFCLPKWL